MPLPQPTVDVRLQTLAAAHRQWREGDFARATAYAQMVFNWFPNDPQTWKCLMLILLAQGRWANASLALKQALSFAPADPALQLWAQALSCGDVYGMSNHDTWLRSLADAMLVEATPQDAEDLAWVAMRLGVASPWVMVCRAKALGLLKRVAEARGLLRNALGDEAASPLHWLALAQLDLDAHHVDEAVAVLREGLMHFSDELELKLALSSALLLAGDVAGADAIAFSACTASADEPAFLLQRGMVRMRQRDFLTAQTLFRGALTAWLEAGEPPRIRTLPATGFDNERIERAMWDTLMQLHDGGILAFPTSGTLLGLTRDGGLLPFDKDWDFGVPWEQMPAAVNCLLRHGWVEYACSYGLSNPRALRQVESGLVLDLCGLTPDQGGGRMLGGFWMGSAPVADDRVTVFPMLDLQKVSRGTGHVWMPVNADAWLQALYGNWREPDPDFDTVVAAQNLRDFSPLTHCYALIRIATRWQQGQRAKVLSLLRHARKHLPDDGLLLRLEQHVGRSTNAGSHE